MIGHSIGRLTQCCILACCLVLGASLPAPAELDLRLDSTRPQYLVDEFLYVTVTLSNVGSGDAPFSRLLDPAAGILSFEITTPDGLTHRYQPRGSASLSPGAPERSIQWLTPGGQYTTSIDLSYELTRVPGKSAGTYEVDGVVKSLPGSDEVRPNTVLCSPGNYSIRACYAIPEDWALDPIMLWSGELLVSVAEPAGTDLAALQLTRAGPSQDREPWSAATEQADAYEQVISDYPASAYAVYARWALASIRSFSGSQILRGAPEAPGLLEESADLFLTVARDAGQTSFGLRATEAAAKTLAQLGRSAQAQALLDDAFFLPGTTDTDRRRLIGVMALVETGELWRGAGLPGEPPPTGYSVPLRNFAEALGFALDWDVNSNTVAVSSRRISAAIHPGDDVMVINGLQWPMREVSLEDGQVYVAPSVLFSLILADWGRKPEDLS